MKAVQVFHAVSRFSMPLVKAYWFLVRPKTYGVKCLVEHDGRFLMIRNTYGYQRWTFPGGKIEPGEAPEEAARRETLEEVGITLNNLTYLGSYYNTRQYKRDTVHCFYALAVTPDYVSDPIEIVEARWAPFGALPEPLSAGALDVLSLYRQRIRNP